MYLCKYISDICVHIYIHTYIYTQYNLRRYKIPFCLTIKQILETMLNVIESRAQCNWEHYELDPTWLTIRM